MPNECARTHHTHVPSLTPEASPHSSSSRYTTITLSLRQQAAFARFTADAESVDAHDAPREVVVPAGHTYRILSTSLYHLRDVRLVVLGTLELHDDLDAWPKPRRGV